jgi:hypothetical protein
MKFGYVLTGVAAAGLTLALTAAWPQDAKAKAKPPAKPQAGQAGQAGDAAKPQAGEPVPGGMAKKAMMPNENHAHLAALVGTWNASVKQWDLPGQPPQESTGTVVYQMIMDGRFLMESVTGQTPAGAYQGMGLYGHDNVTGKFESVWLDNQGTGMAKSTGEWVDELPGFKWNGQFSNLKNGGITECHSIMKKVSDTEYHYELHEKRGEKLFRSMEITYKKA